MGHGTRAIAASNEHGYSMIELLVSLVILMIISGTVMDGVLRLTRTNQTVANRSEMHAGVRNVTELLQAEDDLQVIFGAGDELTVAFDAPPAPPRAGWRRDFLLHNVGWDKDNDLNVVTSQVVEPLPFHAMSGYPYRADEEFPDTQAHREYLRKYQTRIQSPVQFWRQTQRFGAKAR